MKISAIKPLYIEGKLVSPGQSFDTTDVHGKELVKKGYGKEVDEKAAKKATAEKSAADKAAK